MPDVHIEFLVEPFNEGKPGAHVLAGIEAARAHGLEPDVGPFGTTVTTTREGAGALLGDVVAAALARGATRVAVQVTQVGG